ncbi:MAG: LLM class flavin-dependent oxidoreductase, partial [Gammaproteobacteria bacterium]|nr:LLM class flavin-dependent oxidoreductase [Gammaproteobacteria bacterium]
IDLGIGIGWCKEEVEACGYAFEDRGERCDEILDLMKRLWTEERVTHDGKHFQLQSCRMDPKPVQKPHIPIIAGRLWPPTMRRTAARGSGWFGFALNPKLTERWMGELAQAMDAAGRPRDDYEVIITPNTLNDDLVREFKDLGVDRLIPFLGPGDEGAVSERLAELERFAALAA